MSDWNPAQYLAFADERARPALDLIARLPNRAPHSFMMWAAARAIPPAFWQTPFPKQS